MDLYSNAGEQQYATAFDMGNRVRVEAAGSWQLQTWMSTAVRVSSIIATS
jgi:hypothetical protein